ncbi:12417_t:CDS:2, partial [Acaulospora colombiana]
GEDKILASLDNPSLLLILSRDVVTVEKWNLELVSEFMEEDIDVVLNEEAKFFGEEL